MSLNTITNVNLILCLLSPFQFKWKSSTDKCIYCREHICNSNWCYQSYTLCSVDWQYAGSFINSFFWTAIGSFWVDSSYVCLSYLVNPRMNLTWVIALLPLSQKTSHSRIRNLSQKTSHLTRFGKCLWVQESNSTKYG